MLLCYIYDLYVFICHLIFHMFQYVFYVQYIFSYKFFFSRYSFMVLYVFLFSSCSRFFFFFMFILLQRNCIRVTTPDQEPEGRNLGQGRAKQGLV